MRITKLIMGLGLLFISIPPLIILALLLKFVLRLLIFIDIPFKGILNLLYRNVYDSDEFRLKNSLIFNLYCFIVLIGNTILVVPLNAILAYITILVEHIMVYLEKFIFRKVF